MMARRQFEGVRGCSCESGGTIEKSAGSDPLRGHSAFYAHKSISGISLADVANVIIRSDQA